MATLEKDDPGLSVWLTLPVEPDGLQDDAQSVIKEMLNDHVSIAGINVMAMDFATAPAAGSSMAASAEAALSATQGQLAKLYPTYGIKLRQQEPPWAHLDVVDQPRQPVRLAVLGNRAAV